MKNLPLKERIEELLEPERTYSGVWKDKDKEMYIKLTSKLWSPVVSIKPSDYDNPKDALEDTIACAKVYKRFIKEGLYHPNTQVVVCQDDKDNLALMITMPELKIDRGRSAGVVGIKLQDILKRVGLEYDKYNFTDLTTEGNWGYDKKTKELYAHDLHISFKNIELLGIAKDLGYKK